jgi:hypothetical protein
MSSEPKFRIGALIRLTAKGHECFWAVSSLGYEWNALIIDIGDRGWKVLINDDLNDFGEIDYADIAHGMFEVIA